MKPIIQYRVKWAGDTEWHKWQDYSGNALHRANAAFELRIKPVINEGDKFITTSGTRVRVIGESRIMRVDGVEEVIYPVEIMYSDDDMTCAYWCEFTLIALEREN